MSKKRNRRPMPTPPTAPEAVTPDAAAVVADAQSLVSDEPEAQTPDAATPKAVAETVPTRAYVKSLRALSVKAVKAGDTATADTLTAAANLAEQQVEQQEQERKAKTAHSSALLAFLQKLLPICYAGDISDRERIAKALGVTADDIPNAPPNSPFTARFSLEPPFVENATRGRKQGDTAPRATINASDLKAASVEAFLMPDGSEMPPTTVHGKPVKAHPVAYLDALGVCRYDRDCTNAEHTAAAERGDKEIAGRTFTDAQRQKFAAGDGLRHGDSASREFASHGATDTVHNARMTDGSIQPVKDIVAQILATAS